MNQAIDRGRAYLRNLQVDSGAWSWDGSVAERNQTCGVAALAGLALLESGVPITDAAVQKAAKYVRQQAPARRRTYEISLSLLFLDRLGEPEDRPLLQNLALRLAYGQKAAGGWSYSCLVPPQGQEGKWLQQLRQQNPALAEKEVAALFRPDVKGDRSVKLGEGDNSNTQFALLALWAARRYGLPLDATVARSVQRFRSSQQAGGWGYGAIPSARPYGSMTCAGLLALAVGRSWGPEPQVPPAASRRPQPADPGIARGLEALGGYLDDPVDSRFFDSTKGVVNLYFLWSVERVGVAYGLKTIGGRDWYQWGMKLLLAGQKADGSWFGGRDCGSSHVIGTSFALLFLKRADLMPGLSERLRTRLGIADTPPDKRDPKGPKDRPPPKEKTEPLKVDLGAVHAGTASELKFVVRGPKPFRITKVEGGDEALTVRADSQPRDAHTLSAAVRPEKAGTLTRTLRLHTDLPGRAMVEVTLTLKATAPE